MSAIEVRAIAEETIRWWKQWHDHRPPLRAREAWDAITGGERYPGGGWEHVRARMVDWMLTR